MNENRFDTTAANILSSLKVRGASLTGGRGKEGYVPVLGSDGTLDLSVIPSDSASALIDIAALRTTAFVDANASYPSGVSPTGSIAKPFKTLKAAADAGFGNFVLVGGAFGTETVSVSNAQHGVVRIFSLGQSTFDALTLSGYTSGTVFEFSDVSVLATLMFSGQMPCRVSLLGDGSVRTLRALNSASVDATVDAGFVVEDTIGDVDIAYGASSDRIANASSVAGDTVSDALDAVGVRKVRIPVFTYDETGVHADDYVDIAASDGLYSLLGLANIAEAVTTLFHKDGDDVAYNDVQATDVRAGSVVADSTTTESLNFGDEGTVKAVVSVSEDNFLEVATQPEETTQGE